MGFLRVCRFGNLAATRFGSRLRHAGGDGDEKDGDGSPLGPTAEGDFSVLGF